MDIFSTGVLKRVVTELPQPAPFILNTFFREEQLDTSEEIHFDVDTGKRRIAPFVSPIVAGKVVESRGFQTKTFKPAYIKDKRVFNPARALKRSIGERIGGEFTPDQRRAIMLATELQDQLDMLTRRMEVMAIEAMRTGKVTVAGDEYPSVEVNFGREATLTKALTLAARWGETGVKPLVDVKAWSMEVTQHSGTTANVVVMDAKAWDLFYADEGVQKELDRFRGTASFNPIAAGEGGRFMGTIGDLEFWVYAGWYVNPANGNLTPYLPDYTVIVSSPQLEGVRAFGAILDEEAGIQALPYFPKSWVEKDPGVRYLLMQSAPLPVPYRVNASLGATVR